MRTLLLASLLALIAFAVLLAALNERESDWKEPAPKAVKEAALRGRAILPSDAYQRGPNRGRSSVRTTA